MPQERGIYFRPPRNLFYGAARSEKAPAGPPRHGECE
jgi:hypothetical protein